jgi:hypothetical protein
MPRMWLKRYVSAVSRIRSENSKAFLRTDAADSATELRFAGELAGGVGDVLRVDTGPGQ